MEGDLDPTPDPACLALAARFAVVIGKMRGEARFNFKCFVDAAEAEVGGQLILTAPKKSSTGKAVRRVPEARYMGESDVTIL